MRRSTCCLLAILFGSWLSSFAQSAPRLTSPKIVATFERIGQTAEIPPTIIYTPKKWGTFRISIVMVGTEASGNGDAAWTGNLQFWDGAGENQPPYTYYMELQTDIRETASAEIPIRARAGKPIKFSVGSINGSTEGSKYNVWVVVEQLM
jgi:hypothetical protein